MPMTMHNKNAASISIGLSNWQQHSVTFLLTGKEGFNHNKFSSLCSFCCFRLFALLQSLLKEWNDASNVRIWKQNAELLHIANAPVSCFRKNIKRSKVHWLWSRQYLGMFSLSFSFLKDIWIDQKLLYLYALYHSFVFRVVTQFKY